MTDRLSDPGVVDGPGPQGLTPEERRIWELEGFDQLRRFLDVPTVARILGISRSTAYACVEDGTIPAVKIRRRRLIPRHALFAVLCDSHSPSTRQVE
ncbi:MAG: helix-turn-helix domain-containing protein [Actinomycetota bacterium]